jgi:hypothetical protein
LTKHLHDEAIGKLPLSLDDAGANLKLIEAANTLGICQAELNPINSVTADSAEHLTVKAKTKMVSLKSKVGKIMHKLYDLEPENAPEKPLNVDLGVDLYQMENY